MGGWGRNKVYKSKERGDGVKVCVHIASRKVWEHTPQGKFWIIESLRLLLVHFQVTRMTRSLYLCFCLKFKGGRNSDILY